MQNLRHILCFSALVATFTVAISLQAALSFNSDYAANTLYTHSTTDSIISFDWDASDRLYYMSSAGFPDTKVWRYTGSTPVSLYADPANYSGASVVSIGDYVYFNDSFATTNIWRFGPVDAAPATQLTSTDQNFGLYGHNGDLFITGAAFGQTNRIYYTTLAANGSFSSSPPIDLGVTFGGSGPMAFDAAGNLYYAPGYNDASIYRWDAADVQTAISSNGTTPLPTSGVLWHDYSANYGGYGATGMTFDVDGNLIVTLTQFGNPSYLVRFLQNNGIYAGYNQVLGSTDRLGDVRSYNGDIVIANGNQLLQIIPESAVTGNALGGLVMLLVIAKRRNRQVRTTAC